MMRIHRSRLGRLSKHIKRHIKQRGSIRKDLVGGTISIDRSWTSETRYWMFRVKE